MYAEYFGLREFPFGSTPDPAFFYSNEAWRDTLAVLEDGIKSRSAFCLVTGEAGTGKSILLRRLLHDSIGAAEFVPIIHPGLTFVELMRSILKDCGCGCSSADKQTLAQQFTGYVDEQFAKGCSLAILIDEAQTLSDDVLEQLQLLYSECERRIPIVLMGQPNLESRLDNANLRKLRECITLRRRLIPLQDYDVSRYVKFRLEHAGYDGNELFEVSAIERLRDLSQGIPRLINILCDNALLHAFRASSYNISGNMIDEAGNQLGLNERSRRYAEKIANQLADKPLLDSSLVEHKEVDELTSQWQFGAQSPFLYQDDSPTESVEAVHLIEGTLIKAVKQQRTHSSVDQFIHNWLRNQHIQFKRPNNSIGGLLILIFSAWGLVAIDSKHRELSRSDVSGGNEERSSNAAVLAVPDMPIDRMSHESALTKQLQPELVSHQDPDLLQVHSDQPTVAAENGKVAINRKVVQEPSAEIYRVTGPVILRNTPTADAEIITTIEPETRVAVTRMSNDYFRVRSLADERISGFVHREDAFFERNY
jgi:type II secretory pathway predicted ATPase ExeA